MKLNPLKVFTLLFFGFIIMYYVSVAVHEITHYYRFTKLCIQPKEICFSGLSDIKNTTNSAAGWVYAEVDRNITATEEKYLNDEVTPTVYGYVVSFILMMWFMGVLL